MFPVSRGVGVGRDRLERGLGRVDELRCRQGSGLALDRLKLGRLDAGDPMLLEPPRVTAGVGRGFSWEAIARMAGERVRAGVA